MIHSSFKRLTTINVSNLISQVIKKLKFQNKGVTLSMLK